MTMSEIKDPMTVLLELLGGLFVAENLGDVKDAVTSAWRDVGLIGDPIGDDGDFDLDVLSAETGLGLPDGVYTKPSFDVHLSWHDAYGEEYRETVTVTAPRPMWAARMAYQQTCVAFAQSQPDPFATAKVGDETFQISPIGSCIVEAGDE